MEPLVTDTRDQHGRLRSDRGAWRQATTLEAAGELTARWLESHSEYQPGTFAPSFDEETRPIAAELAEINRNGLFTKESQPGIRSDTGHAQRQYVTGFCSAAAAAELMALSTRSELVSIGHAPGEVSAAAVPVTFDGDAVVTVLGSSENPVDEDALRDWSEETNDALALLLADSWYVEVLDPVWGRNDVLLPEVLAALRQLQ
ncbi:hypothetical protein TV39_06635 [Arthrobacter sp. SPG23]|uniref:DUF6919 domain-containing protein n=1 Tax=Arthrobacter sp. SPG23 TaxID=1610703 RepID=UPI0005BA0629|nr:hypothetical protein [Arthrobacter sp. SPG23]KIS28248.1 hypothetical protein TV39_06635 [Arthrobacter sp. SPG23]